MRVNFSDKFKKNYKKRVNPDSSLENKYVERFKVFVNDSSSPILKDHALTGKLIGFRAFRITGDFRVVYFKETIDLVTFIDIGTHNQVYS